MNDSISRQAAIDAAIEAVDSWDGGCNIGRQKRIENYIKRLPPVQLATDTNVGTKLGTNLAEVGTDCISRQAAIDAVDSETVSTNPENFKSSEKFIKFMDDADIASFGKWQWANGFNTALVAVTIHLKKLPSAQPEPLTDKEQRIFLAAMGREEKVCEEVDRNYVGEPYEDSLVRVCKEIRRKVKGALWT